MPEYLPIASGSFYRRCGSGALEGLSRYQPLIGQIEWHGDELADVAHGVSFTFF